MRNARAVLLIVLVLAVAAPAGAAPGDISRFAGGFNGDGGPAAGSVLRRPYGLALDAAGNLYLADQLANVVRRVDATTGLISTVAGRGTYGFSGDGGPATSAQLASPTALAVDALGNIYIADSSNGRIRKVSGGTISTIAGGGVNPDVFGFYPPDALPATLAVLRDPYGLALAPDGALFISDTGSDKIRRLDPATGMLTTVIGAGSVVTNEGFAGDGGPAILGKVASPSGLALRDGRLYVADAGNNRIRVIDLNAAPPTIDTLAGNGEDCGAPGNGGPALAASLCGALWLTLDAAGNVLISEHGAPLASASVHRVRRISAGVISMIAGGVTGAGFGVDGGAATSALLNGPKGLAVDAGGNILVSDGGNHRVRRIAPAGTISTVVGMDTFTGDGGPATSAVLYYPTGIATDAAGNVLVTDSRHYRLRSISPAGIITTVAGTGVCAPFLDGTPALSATLCNIRDVTAAPNGDLFIAAFRRVYRVSGGLVSTYAGTGGFGALGDGGPATAATIRAVGVALDASGNLYIADEANRRVRRVDATTGIITTVAGKGSASGTELGDGGPATDAYIGEAEDVAVRGSLLYIADRFGGRVRMVDLTTGVITTVAGGIGTPYYQLATNAGMIGDGGPATQAYLEGTRALTFDAAGNLFIVESSGCRVRRVAPGADGLVDGDADDIITTFAGTGARDSTGDGGPATAAALYSPVDVAAFGGNVYIADYEESLIRVVSG